MSDIKPALGQLALSKAGRDAGRTFVVTGVLDSEYVLIADGDLRRLSCPKKKKLKHLRLQPVILSPVAEKLAEGKKVFDAELRSAIAAQNGKSE